MSQRIEGLDLARGVALVGMLAVHVFPTFDGDGSASLATQIASGRSSAVFATMAGVGLALVTGGRNPVSGKEMNRSAVAIAVRAGLIGLLGLLMGYVTAFGHLDVYIILPSYAMMFLLVLPALRLRPTALFAVAGVVGLAAPLLIDVFFADGPRFDPEPNPDPTLGHALAHPFGLPVYLLVGGSYPALTWVTFLLVGLGLGRLDLAARRVAVWCVAAGSALAITAWTVSQILLYPLGGLRELRRAAPRRWSDERILWAPFPGDLDTPWWYAVRAPHSDAPLAIAIALGSAVAVFGVALLIGRSRRVERLLAPLAAAGSMILTLYCAHIVVLATGLFEERPGVQFCLLLAAMLAFATWWRPRHRRGPLEALVAMPVAAVRRAMTPRSTSTRIGTR